MPENAQPVASLLHPAGAAFDELSDRFRWSVPERFNIARAVCSRHAVDEQRLALIACGPDGRTRHVRFAELERDANRLANWLAAQGVVAGDRLAVILPQRPETALLHLAAHKLGAISLPLSILFGAEALQYRLQDSGARVVLTLAERGDMLCSMTPGLPGLQHALLVDVAAGTGNSQGSDAAALELHDFAAVLESAPATPRHADTHREDPALLLYTSGTTGPPKGALIPHRALIGNLTGFELSHDGFPQADDVMYTPADWAWTGGLMDALLPAWYYGCPVVAHDTRKFDPVSCLSVMAEHRVTCAFFPPTALKMLRVAESEVKAVKDGQPGLQLRSIMSAGESLGAELHHWCHRVLGVTVNEMCGQTEHNYVMGNSSTALPVRPGSIGKAYAGHRVEIMNTTGQVAPVGQTGEFMLHRDDPVHFLGYWQSPEATARKYLGDWFHTGDMGYRDADGYLWFVGRADDVINSAGYRIGPGEIENCALQHPAVLQAAAIGVPDPEGLRGEVVKLCVVVRPGHAADEALADVLRAWVRERLAAYEYPRLIEYLNELPMTTTGKIQRGELRRLHQS